MIRKLVDFALNNRFVVITMALLVFFAGGLAFHDMPVEAYPDIADNYVTIISQWPGRSAEEVEQQVSIPIEIQMGGLPHLAELRSESLFGLFFMTPRSTIGIARRYSKDSRSSACLRAFSHKSELTGA